MSEPNPETHDPPYGWANQLAAIGSLLDRLDDALAAGPPTIRLDYLVRHWASLLNDDGRVFGACETPRVTISNGWDGAPPWSLTVELFHEEDENDLPYGGWLYLVSYVPRQRNGRYSDFCHTLDEVVPIIMDVAYGRTPLVDQPSIMAVTRRSVPGRGAWLVKLPGDQA